MTIASRIPRPAALALLAFVALPAGVALAQATPTGPATPVLDLTTVIAVIAAIVGGIGMLLGGLSVILHAIAPRTKTTVDDRLATAVDAAHSKLDELLGMVRVLTPGASASASPPTAPPAPAAKSAVPSVGMLAVLLIGLGALTQLPACSGSTQASRAATLSAALVTANAGRQALIAYDTAEETAIVSSATSLTDGQAALATFRTKIAGVETALTAAYNAIAIATALNDSPSLAGAQTALTQAIAAISTLTGGDK